MKVGDFVNNPRDYEDFIMYLYQEYGDHIYFETIMREKVTYLFETYRHNYFCDFVVDLKQNENDNIMIEYYRKYGVYLDINKTYYVRDYTYLIDEYETLKQKLTTEHSKKYLASENITTNESTGSNENVAVASNTLNTEKTNQGTPIDTNIWGVGNTLSAEKGTNTNNENTTTTHTNSENATNTTVSNFNVNYILTLDNYDALIELDKKLRDHTEDLINRYFYKPFKEIFINAIDFERIERIRGY